MSMCERESVCERERVNMRQRERKRRRERKRERERVSNHALLPIRLQNGRFLKIINFFVKMSVLSFLKPFL